MKSLGQHFLKNIAAIKKTIAAIDIKSDETVIEIGPGHGELTILLADTAQKNGAKIIAIEKDKHLVVGLQQRATNEGWRNIKILEGDVLEVLPTLFEDKPSLAHTFKIVGNIPYYLTGHLLRAMGELEAKPERAILMIQKEVAERICAVSPKMNRLAASVQFWAEPKIVLRVPRNDFSPPPEVDSAVIGLKTREPQAQSADAARYYAAMHILFAQPRKTILNNLAAMEETHHRNQYLRKNDLEMALLKLGVDPKSRPQNLTIENIMKISEIIR